MQVAVWPEDTQYGDLDADGQDEAAVSSTAIPAVELLVIRYRALTSSSEELMGFLSQSERLRRSRNINPLPLLRLVCTRHDSVRTALLFANCFYRSSDANCCPTGEADITWTLQDNRLVAGPPVVVS